MSLKELVAKRILDEVIGASYKPGKWKVLVMDKLGTQIVSSCCKMHDIMNKGITLVESLEKSRAPQLSMEAIYIIWPSDESIKKLIEDFSDDYRLYSAAHVFLLDRLPPPILAKLSESKNLIKFLKCLKETYVGFLPKESRVFSLNYPEAFPLLFSPGTVGKGEMKERIADQLATLCALLGEFPAIRCHCEVDGMEDIATALHKRLQDLRKQDPSFATGEMKNKTELILLDRGFDVVSPLVHELTYQAMVYDLLGIKKDVYSYQAATEGGFVRARDIILDETDEVWVKLRHMHFAEVKREVGEMVATFTKTVQRRSDPGRSDMSIKDLHKLIKETPQHHKELSKFSRHLSLVEGCDKKFKGGFYELCKAEQDLATGKDEAGEPTSRSMGLTAHILVDRKYNVYDKIRLIMLQLLCHQGMSKDDLGKVIEKADIPDSERHAILTLASLGYHILTDVKAEGTTVKTGRKGMKRKERLEGRYVISRWTPVIQDIMENAVEGTLDQSYCPKLSDYPGSVGRDHSASASVSSSLPQSVRSQRWNWVTGSSKKRTQSQGPAEDPAVKVRVIVFVVGGLTHSEIRTAYEVAQNYPSHDIIVGSTHIVTPANFIGQLHQLDIPYRGVK